MSRGYRVKIQEAASDCGLGPMVGIYWQGFNTQIQASLLTYAEAMDLSIALVDAAEQIKPEPRPSCFELAYEAGVL